jgi:hypothetical protein
MRRGGIARSQEEKRLMYRYGHSNSKAIKSILMAF